MPGPLSPIDWAIIALYVVFALWVGVRFSKRAGQNVDEYFLSGRSLPWWIAGTSMVATSYAADTPLLITGWVRDEGIWKNWVWWCILVNGAFQVFLFARWWRRAGVMTKAQLVELRYGGTGATVLRGTLGVLHAALVNTMTICWVMLAAAKISQVLFEVEPKIGLTVACIVAMGYSLAAGFWGVVVTDVVQFVFAMSGGIALAFLCWSGVGGADAIAEALADGRIAPERLLILPESGADGFWTASVAAFAVYLGVAWWAAENVDGSGVGVQRISACRDERHGMLALVWYSIAHYALRPWCWILVGLASLLVLPNLEVVAPREVQAGVAVTHYRVTAVEDDAIVLRPERTSDTAIPLDKAAWADLEANPARVSLAVPDATDDWRPLPIVAADEVVAAGAPLARTDSELAYMVMMLRYLPAGLLGLVAASLIAAFMSTIDTHVNLASSFFVNDIWRRFFVRDAGAHHYVRVARIASVVVLLLGSYFASQAQSVRALFEFFLAFLAGVGPVYVLRWLWWKIRASTEITAMLTSAVVSTGITRGWFGIEWDLGALSPDGVLSGPGRVVIVAVVSIAAALVSMVLTRRPNPASLVAFYRQTRPIGWWGPVRELAAVDDAAQRREVLPALLGALGMIALVYGSMLGLGYYFLDQERALFVAAGTTLVGTLVVLWAIRRILETRVTP